MKKIFTNLLFIAFSTSMVFAQQANNTISQTKWLEQALNWKANSINLDQSKVKNGTTTTNGTLKTSMLTYYTVDYKDVAVSQGYLPKNYVCLIFPDTSAIWERNDTTFGEYGKNRFGSIYPYSWINGSFGFSDVFTPGTQLISKKYTPGSGTIQFSPTNPTVVDSVSFFYLYNRARAYPTTVDTLIVYLVDNANIQTLPTGGGFPATGDPDYNAVRIGNYDYATNSPASFFKTDTILLSVLDSSDAGYFNFMTLSVDSHIIVPGGSMGIAWKYLPGRAINEGDTIVDMDNRTAKSDQSIFGVATWFEDGTALTPQPLATSGLESPVGNMAGWLSPQ